MKHLFIFLATLSFFVACNNEAKIRQEDLSSVLLSDSGKKATCVFLTSDERNRPVISWCETNREYTTRDFYMSYYNEYSNNFSDRISIPIEQNASLHEEGMPKIAIKSDGTIVAVYETSAPTDSNSFAGFVRYIVSADKGKTWTQPVCLHADTAPGKSHSFAVIARLADGEIGASWLDESFDRRIGGRPVKFAKTNQENRFTGEVTIDSVACQCCRIAMSSNKKGKIYVAFRDIISNSIRDMSVSTSDDNGRTFTPASSFSDDNWVINGCPHNGPSLAANENSAYATWFTGGGGKGVYYCELNKERKAMNKQLVSEHGRFIQLCILPGGDPVLTYSESVQYENKNYSKIVLNKMTRGKVFERTIKTSETMASYPVIKSFGNDAIVIAWKTDEKVYYTVTNASDVKKEIQRSTPRQSSFVMNLSHIKLAGSADLVCGMPLSLSPGDTTSFDGRVYGFCSATCKEKFLEAPVAFLSKLKSK